jgi:hypothetical protein
VISTKKWSVFAQFPLQCTPPLLNLTQSIDTVGSSNLLDLISSNLSNLSITPVDPGLVKPDNYQIINIHLPFVTCIQNDIYSYGKFSSGVILCFTICSQLATCFVCMVAHLSILLSPASMLLFKMPWRRQFLDINHWLLAAEDRVESYENLGERSGTEAGFCPSCHSCSILNYHQPTRWALALTTQKNITSSISKLGWLHLWPILLWLWSKEIYFKRRAWDTTPNSGLPVGQWDTFENHWSKWLIGHPNKCAVCQNTLNRNSI